MKLVTYAPDAWSLLNGVFCIYKPSGMHVLRAREIIIGNLARDLNQLQPRPPQDFIKIEGSAISGHALTVTKAPNYADHTNVVGPRYQCQDFRVTYATYIGKFTSGLLVMAVNNASYLCRKIHESRLLRTYEITGKFGLITDSFMDTGKVLEKVTYDHIKNADIDRILASVQATHQSSIFHYAGVGLQSQAAYELASRGLVRPASSSPTLIYGARCSDYKPPFFTLEIQCINEDEDYLLDLVHNLGVRLKSGAVSCKIRQIQYGHFTVDHALLHKHWTLENILNNIQYVKHLAKPKLFTPTSPHLQPISSEIH